MCMQYINIGHTHKNTSLLLAMTLIFAIALHKELLLTADLCPPKFFLGFCITSSKYMHLFTFVCIVSHIIYTISKLSEEGKKQKSNPKFKSQSKYKILTSIMSSTYTVSYLAFAECHFTAQNGILQMLQKCILQSKDPKD